MKDKRERDVLIAKFMGLEVVGWSTAQEFPDDPEPTILLGKNMVHTAEKENDKQQPVYVDDCMCEFAEGWPEDEKIHGHYWNCLRVVPEYGENSRDVLKYWASSDKYRSIDFRYSSGQWRVYWMYVNSNQLYTRDFFSDFDEAICESFVDAEITYRDLVEAE